MSKTPNTKTNTTQNQLESAQDHGLNWSRFTFNYVETVVVESCPQGACILIEVPLLVLCLTHVTFWLGQHHFCIFFKAAIFNRQCQSVFTIIYVQILSCSWVTTKADKIKLQISKSVTIVLILILEDIKPVVWDTLFLTSSDVCPVFQRQCGRCQLF